MANQDLAKHWVPWFASTVSAAVVGVFLVMQFVYSTFPTKTEAKTKHEAMVKDTQTNTSEIKEIRTKYELNIVKVAERLTKIEEGIKHLKASQRENR